MSFNKVILVGNMVADPELKKTTNGTSVVTFRIAVGRNYSRNGEPQTDFFNATAWNQK
ncbi:MAG: single-stranded DNA-binding protein, partial [Clostridia bacterium]|nr:single-stranded DNA-binding protein [Clostridia bacterium]